SVDGPGLRTSIYVAGCRHRCAGCHNPQTWDFSQGVEMTVSDIMEVIEENGFNVTLTGGDPLYSLPAITPLVVAVAEAGYTIWLYTGFTYSSLLELPGIEKILPYIEAIVDGPFEADKRDVSLHFRGSSNQRIIDVKKSLASGEVVTFEY
ncbi:MAG: anaerobic ribonucleoside-triphosphate reductase activating protein, partial [Muribaculaceae bacterium]|nr:anaerobic ribonucleoside-triphosphate reductase activating protein [Muribaculaceae bacterium]